MSEPVVYFYTDFGGGGPYTGLMESALLRHCPAAKVIDLLSEAPAFSPRHASCLLAAMVPWLLPDSTVVAVVDPGVGGPRMPIVVESGGRRYLGPDNGLFSGVMQGDDSRAWLIRWPEEMPSASFHGRDLFAPAAGKLLAGEALDLEPLPRDSLEGHDWPLDLHEVIFIDHFGNVMTGLRASALKASARIAVAGRVLRAQTTFSDVPVGEPFWYRNSLGLVEIAVNRGRADRTLGLSIGDPVAVLSGEVSPLGNPGKAG